jgi:hypothetical protein
VSDPVFDETATARRVAENDNRFRQANKNIQSLATRMHMERIPFICECADLRCTRVLQLTHEEYENVRRSGRRFVVAAPEHGGDRGAWTRVVEEHGDYVVVEKLREAGAIAEELDRRADDND